MNKGLVYSCIFSKFSIRVSQKFAETSYKFSNFFLSKWWLLWPAFYTCHDGASIRVYDKWLWQNDRSRLRVCHLVADNLVVLDTLHAWGLRPPPPFPQLKALPLPHQILKTSNNYQSNHATKLYAIKCQTIKWLRSFFTTIL